MVARDTAWPAGTPCWADLAASDTAQAKAFYSALLGWDIQDGPPEIAGYAICLMHGEPVAGIGTKMEPAGAPVMWTAYLATDDADDTAAAIAAAGGKLLIQPFDVLDSGRMALAADPAGAVFGIWQAGSHAGFGLAGEPGAVCWNEQMSRDLDASKTFYQAVFGYEFGDMSGDGFRYATLNLGGETVGGIGSLSGPRDHNGTEPPPASWATYFSTEDTDTAVDKVTALGGSIIQPAWDTPYGRTAVVRDDQGAVFSLLGMQLASGA